MEHIGSYDAKTKFAGLLRQVEHGRSFMITRNGVSIAEIRPAGRGSVEERLARIYATRTLVLSQLGKAISVLDKESLRAYACTLLSWYLADESSDIHAQRSAIELGIYVPAICP